MSERLDTKKPTEAVALALWGQPNPHKSSKNELRWGSNGARSVDLRTGTWADFSEEHGSINKGDALDLVQREKGMDAKEAIAWLREQGHLPRAEARRDDGYDRRDDDRRPADSGGRPQIVATYNYEDENGDLAYQVVRLEPKSFRQRRPAGRYLDGATGWIHGLVEGVYSKGTDGGWYRVKDAEHAEGQFVAGTRYYPYRLPDLIEAIASGHTVYVVEGEKDADNLWAIGIPATTSAAGAGKWQDDLNDWFGSADVVILCDNDDAGRKHRDGVARALKPFAGRVRALDLPGLPEKGDVSDWLAAGGSADEFQKLGAAAPAWTPEPFKSRFGAVLWNDLDEPGPEIEWLIQGLLSRGEQSMLAGPSMSGKSFMAVDMAMAVARGSEWRGKRTLKGGVIYQAGEGAKGIRKRLRAYRQEFGVHVDDDVPFVLLPSAIDLYASDDHTNALIEEGKHWAETFSVPLELLVIDTFSTATPGANENASEDVTKILARCNSIARALNCHVMIVHHMNAAGARPRGHSSMVANLETVLECRIKEGHHDANKRAVRELRVAKLKDGDPIRPMDFVLRRAVLGEDKFGDPVSSCVVDSPDHGAMAGVDPAKTSGIRLSDKAGVFVKSLFEAIEKKGEQPPAALQLPSGIVVAEWKHAREIYAKQSFDGEDERDEATRREAQRKAIQRWGEKLLAANVIGRGEADGRKFVWFTGKRIKGFRAPPKPVDLDDQKKVEEGAPAADQAPPAQDYDLGELDL